MPKLSKCMVSAVYERTVLNNTMKTNYAYLMYIFME